MINSARIIIIIFTLLVVSGCAGHQYDYETPTVNVSSFRALQSESITPRFEIGLHIINPNRSALKLQGIVYSLSLEGHRILTGVANDLPTIEAYGEEDVVLYASADIISSIGLFADLMKQQRDTFSYDLDAKLDIGSFRPRIHVRKQGDISLTSTPR